MSRLVALAIAAAACSTQSGDGGALPTGVQFAVKCTAEWTCPNAGVVEHVTHVCKSATEAEAAIAAACLADGCSCFLTCTATYAPCLIDAGVRDVGGVP